MDINNVDPQLVARIGALLNSPDGQDLRRMIEKMDKIQLIQKVSQLDIQNISNRFGNIQNISDKELAKIITDLISNKL